MKEVEIVIFPLQISDDADIYCDFILNLMKDLKYLKKVTLKGRMVSNKIIQLCLRIKNFLISSIIFKHLPAETYKIIRTLRTRKIDYANSGQHLLNLIVNTSQWRKLQVYEDVESLTTFSTDQYARA